MNIYKDLEDRIWVDIDNERPYESDVVGLSKSNEATYFGGSTLILKEGQYIYMYTLSLEANKMSYIFSEWYVIANPYKDLNYRWCCRIAGEIEFIEEYRKRFGKDDFRSDV